MQSGSTVPVSLSEIARRLQADTDTVRYWVKLLDLPTTKAGKLRCISSDGALELERMAAIIAGGTTPGDAARVIRTAPAEIAPVAIDPRPVSTGEDTEQIKNTLMLLTEAVKRLCDENKAIRAENAEMRHDLAAIRAAILPDPSPRRAVIPWRPESGKDPLEGVGMFRRLWIEFIHPERCRRLNG